MITLVFAMCISCKVKMSIDRVIALISSIGTLISSIIVLLTLLEMKKQRACSLMPDLIVGNKSFYLYYYCGKYYWCDKRIDKSEEILGMNRDKLFVHVNNIGSGSAKNINVQWTYNVRDLVDIVNSKNKKSYKVQYDAPYVLSLNANEEQAAYALENELKKTYEFILSSNIKCENYLIDFPMSYLQLARMIISLDILDEKEVIKLFDMFKVKLEMVFYDIEGIKYRKKYIGAFDFFFFRSYNSSIDEPQLITQGIIEFRKDK